MTRYFSLAVLLWKLQIPCSTISERMKAPTSLTLAVYH